MLDIDAALDAATVSSALDRFDRMRDRGRRFADRRVAAPADLEIAALHASACLSALMTAEDPNAPFRFVVSLRPELHGEAPGDFACYVEDDSVLLEIFSVPRKLVDAPDEFKLPIFVFLCAQAYVNAVARDRADHQWGVANPAKQLALDALTMCGDAIEQARHSIWN